MQYTEDFKRGIVRALIASGMSRKEFADKAEIGVGTLKRWVAQYKDEEVPKVDRKKYSEEYKKSIVKNMIYDGITCEIVHALSAILGKKEKRGLSVEENVHNLSHGS